MKNSVKSQKGMFLIEALIGILVFSLGVLAMVALGTAAVSAQSDAQYRTEAATLAKEISSQIVLKADRLHASNATQAQILAEMNASVGIYAHRLGGATCLFDGSASSDALVTAWVTKVTGALPGVPAKGLQIDTSTLAAFSGIRVTICWQGPTDKAVRSHTLVTYVN